MSYNVAVLGATGNVGREMIKILAEREFPVHHLDALASAQSAGKEISFGDDDVVEVKALDQFDFDNVDIVLSSLSSGLSAQYLPKAVDKGALVIDNSSHFRMHDDVGLVIPEVNPHDIHKSDKSFIIANPNCVFALLALPLYALSKCAKIKSVVVTAFQSVAGAGKAGMDELYDQTKGIFMNQYPDPTFFEKQIAFNVLPKIGDIHANGNTDEEQKISDELHKVFGDDIVTSITSVRVPVFGGHSITLRAEFDDVVELDRAEQLLKAQKGLQYTVRSSDNQLITPLDIVGEDSVYVSRLRQNDHAKNTIDMWITGDNLRKGAALNAVQIAELAIREEML